MKRHFILALAVAVCALPVWCATLEQLSLDDMVVRSTVIVRARVAGTPYAAFSGPVIYTHYPIRVSERLKGSLQGLTEVVVPGGSADGLRQTFEGAPILRPGDEYVFMLWTSKSGLTQILGLTQGLFAIAGSGTAGPVATRQASRERMLAPASGRPVKDQTLVMPLSALRSRIAAALAAQRGEVK